MIEKFIIEINNNTNFNLLLKNIVKLTKIGCLIIYLFFILSIIIFPSSIKITLWITVISWFALIMISNDYFIYEKDTIFEHKKNERILNDINFVELLLTKYQLEDNVSDIIKHILKKKEIKKVNWFTLIIPISFIVLLISNALSIKLKIIYMIIIIIIAIFMNHFINYLNNGIHSKEQCNYNYIMFCLNQIKINKLT